MTKVINENGSSTEEILSSIGRAISNDSEETDSHEVKSSTQDKDACSSTEASKDVVILTEMVQNDGSVVSLAPYLSNIDGPIGSIGNDNRTIEEIVSDIVKPMLQEWLDNHLQEIVSQSISIEKSKNIERDKDHEED